jgi:hypothetical protein
MLFWPESSVHARARMISSRVCRQPALRSSGALATESSKHAVCPSSQPSCGARRYQIENEEWPPSDEIQNRDERIVREREMLNVENAPIVAELLEPDTKQMSVRISIRDSTTREHNLPFLDPRPD